MRNVKNLYLAWKLCYVTKNLLLLKTTLSHVMGQLIASRKHLFLFSCIYNTSGTPPRDAAKIARTTIHRVSVGVLRIELVGIWCFVVCRSRARPKEAAMTSPQSMKHYQGSCWRPVLTWMLAAASDELAGHHACSVSMFGDAQCTNMGGMKGELVWRCRSLTQQQAMQVCVDPVRTWLDFASWRRLLREDREPILSNLCTIAQRLTSLVHNYMCSFLVVCPAWIHVGVPYYIDQSDIKCPSSRDSIPNAYHVAPTR